MIVLLVNIPTHLIMLNGNENKTEIYDRLEGLSLMTGYYKYGYNPHPSSPSIITRIVNRLKRIKLYGIAGAVQYYRNGVDKKLPGIDEAVDPLKGIDYSLESYFTNRRIAVFMTSFGGYDTVKEPVFAPDNVDYYLVSDHSRNDDSVWRNRDPYSVLPKDIVSPVVAARWCRMHPHLLFPEYEQAIYLDACTWITSDLTPLVQALQNYPLAMFKHKNRDCVYEEIKACRIKRKDSKKRLMEEEDYIRGLGIPAHWGLLETPVIAFELQDERCQRILEQWWREYELYPGRDQIALIAALWKLGVNPDMIGTMGPDFEQCNLFVRLPHQKCDKKS